MLPCIMQNLAADALVFRCLYNLPSNAKTPMMTFMVIAAASHTGRQQREAGKGIKFGIKIHTALMQLGTAAEHLAS